MGSFKKRRYFCLRTQKSEGVLRRRIIIRNAGLIEDLHLGHNIRNDISSFKKHIRRIKEKSRTSFLISARVDKERRGRESKRNKIRIPNEYFDFII